jgi:hypothetical protein
MIEKNLLAEKLSWKTADQIKGLKSEQNITLFYNKTQYQITRCPTLWLCFTYLTKTAMKILLQLNLLWQN